MRESTRVQKDRLCKDCFLVAIFIDLRVCQSSLVTAVHILNTVTPPSCGTRHKIYGLGPVFWNFILVFAQTGVANKAAMPAKAVNGLFVHMYR